MPSCWPVAAEAGISRSGSRPRRRRAAPVAGPTTANLVPALAASARASGRSLLRTSTPRREAKTTHMTWPARRGSSQAQTAERPGPWGSPAVQQWLKGVETTWYPACSRALLKGSPAGRLTSRRGVWAASSV
ncbi:hypothetical protein AL705_03245 [Lawsonella clevelandensis]|uniref:Uncharacterized protein n=1 Tax=Lawsonella clevelandensis TaxID=1528099 RepID=A0A0M4M834_9ACTN|nr:hypothetical protein AL705_03245 [Lawsonella clevelandensis]